VSRQSCVRIVAARTFQRARRGGSFPALAAPSHRLRNWPSIPSPRLRSLAWRDAKDDAKHGNVRSIHSLTAFTAGNMARDRLWFRRRLVVLASLFRRPSDKCFHRAPILPYFPCSPAVTRFGAYPAPGGTAGSAFSGLLPQPGALGPHSKKCTLGTWERDTSRRFAQECPEGNPGKYNQGELTWLSTKTRSL
jgi:hypothetical protein